MAAYHAPRSGVLKRAPSGFGWQNAAMTTDDPGLPVTHSDFGSENRSPISPETRSFDQPSSSAIARTSSGPAMVSRMPAGG
jgi:hypothetical protein